MAGAWRDQKDHHLWYTNCIWKEAYHHSVDRCNFDIMY